ncbi:unnamed protein product [Toxocara canis]|uniref:G_PROTEIN_RECEP_F1_2 domain-containing protein n=1 Tax=Toxocara canis TaxID=6265 RepID=A0A183TZG2_TOXCA|nr:unnamed protein product [Toxocara canis]
MLLEFLVPNFMLLLAIFGTVGNTLLIIVYISARNLRKEFMIVIGISILALFAAACSFVAAYFNYFNESMKSTGCQLYGFIISTATVACVHQLMLLAFERYLAMIHRTVYERITFHCKLIAFLLVFGYSLAVTVPPLLGWSRYRLVEENIFYCGFDCVTDDFESRSYLVYLFVNAYAIPCIAITTCYTLIYRNINKPLTISRSKTPDETIKALEDEPEATAKSVRHSLSFDTVF